MAKPENSKVQSITTAMYLANESAQRLRDALQEANETEGIVLLDLIERQAELARRIERLRDAVSLDAKGKR